MGVSEIDTSGFYSETYTTPIVSQTTLVAPAAIFSAMVIPAISKAKAKAQEIKCRHNLELLSQAIQVYRLDHQGAFPDKMESLDRNILTPKAFLCPADRNTSGSLDSVTWESLQSDNPASYIFNFPQSLSGTNELLNPPLIVCPFHPHHVLTNGTFQK
jgi:competence protein ComGC